MNSDARTSSRRPLRARAGLLLALALPIWMSIAFDIAPSIRRGATQGPNAERTLAQSQTPQQAYAYAETWSIEDLERQLGPNTAVRHIAPLEIALADDGRLFVADAQSNQVVAFDADGIATDFIAEQGVATDFDPLTCTAGLNLRSLTMDKGGPDASRPEQLHLLWRCEWFVNGNPTQGTRVRRVVLESRKGTSIEGRTLRSDLPEPPMGHISVEESEGFLLYPSGTDLVWLRLQTERFAHRADLVFPRNVPHKKAAGLVYSGDPSFVTIDAVRQRLVLRSASGRTERLLDAEGLEPLSVASLPDGRFVALVRPKKLDPGAEDPIDLDAPLVLAFDVGGKTTGAWSASDLGLVHPPHTGWPWQIDVSQAGFALTTVDDGQLTIAAFDLEGRPRYRVSGRESLPEYDPHFRIPTRSGLRLDSQPNGIGVLDRSIDTVFMLDLTGGFVSASPFVDGADLSLDGLTTYVSTVRSQIHAIRAGADTERVTPPDYPAIHGEVGGRIAAGAGRLYSAWHDQGKIALLDPSSARIRTTLGISGTVGLWPADVAAGPDGRLYTANLAQGHVERWSSAITPTLESRFKAGLLHGPWRIAQGSLPNGREGIAVLTLEETIELHDAESGALASRFEPRLPDGSIVDTEDLALDKDGRVLLAEIDTRKIHVFEPAGPLPAASPTPTPDVGAPPTPTPERRCPMSGDKRVVGPDRIVLGETTEIQITLRADCPPGSTATGADIAIIIDRSGSMQGGNFTGVKNAVHALLQFVDTRYHRVALVSFATGASIDHPLTHDTASLYPVVDRLVQSGGTNAGSGIELADEHLREAGRTDAQPIIIFLSDGRFSGGLVPDEPGEAAAVARGRGVQVFAVGYGTGILRENMLEIAGLESRYREAPDPASLIRVYRGLIREVQSTVTGSLVIDDLMGPRIDFVPGSAQPPALEQDRMLQWGLPILPRGGITLTYTIRPDSVGTLPTNLWATARLRADGGINESFTFPIPEIEVIAPSPTPTATSTATPSNRRVYLPLLLRERCDPDTLANDVVLVLDASMSMLDLSADGRSKMESAKRAMEIFLDLLDLDTGGGVGNPGIDRAAIVSFNQSALLAHGLSRDREALKAALGPIGNAPSTRLDLGIAAATAELEGEGKRGDVGRVIVLLTDGRANPVPISVAEQRAAEAKAKGVTIYTIGLGSEVEAAALARIASQPSNYFVAAGPEALDAIYDQIARTLPCPKNDFWGRR